MVRFLSSTLECMMPKAKGNWVCMTCGEEFLTRRALATHRKEAGHSQKGCPQMTACVGCGVVLPKKECEKHRASCPQAIAIANQNRRGPAMENLKKAREWMAGEGREQNLKTLRRASKIAARSPKARSARSRNMSRMNKTEEARRRASKTAQKTSARPEIQKKRAAVLAKWRKENPEAFAETTKRAQKAAKPSRAESWLQENVLKGLGFRRNAQVRCGEHRKQCDFVRGDFWIEVDGCWHFGMEFAKKRYSAEQVHERDVMLNMEAERRKIVLVRLGLGCWRGNGRYKLKGEWRMLLMALLENPVPGVYLFGECYTQGMWASDKCTTWKYVTKPTISFLQVD